MKGACCRHEMVPGRGQQLPTYKQCNGTARSQAMNHLGQRFGCRAEVCHLERFVLSIFGS